MFRFLSPISLDFDFVSAVNQANMGGVIDSYTNENTPDIEAATIVILGVEEEGNAIGNEGTKHAPNEIRKALYKLFPGEWSQKIVDIGNVVLGENATDTYANLEELLLSLLKLDKQVIVLGGSHDITIALSKAFDIYQKLYNLSIIDATIDASLIDEEEDNTNFLTKILSDESSSLHNISILGLQTYYNHPAKYKIFDKLFVDYYKLSELQKDILNAEPELREAHIVSLDTASIKNTDFPAQAESRPNGFTGQQVCTLARQAGISVKNRIFGLFEYNPFFDKNLVSANLLAQVIWYYIEGIDRKIDDYPNIPKTELLKFHVENDILSLIFYKNTKTNRWWVETREIKMENRLFSCSETDYNNAVNQKITNRIYRIINKNTI